MVKVRDFLNERFKSKRTIPGMRSFHQYVPLGQLSIGCKRVSDDDDFMLQYDFTPNHTQNIPDLRISQFLSCIYDERQWIGMICDIDQENGDVQVKFMHPPYPSRSYKWPSFDDICWVPIVKIVTIIEDPYPTPIGARQYHISNEDLKKIANVHNLRIFFIHIRFKFYNYYYIFLAFPMSTGHIFQSSYRYVENSVRRTNNLLQMYTGDETAGVVRGRCFCADYSCTLVD